MSKLMNIINSCITLPQCGVAKECVVLAELNGFINIDVTSILLDHILQKIQQIKEEERCLNTE